MRSIRTKIMWLLFSSVLISAFLVGLSGIILTSSVIRDSSTENMKLLCKTNADKIDIPLAKVEDSVDTLAHFVGSNLADASMLQDANFRTVFSASVENNALHHIESVEGAVAIYLHYDPALIGETDGFFYSKQDGAQAFSYHPLTDISAFPADDHERVGWWYVPTINGEATWFESYYDTNLDRHIISYVVPIYINSQLIGVIGADISADYIENLVKEVSVFTSGQGAILKSDGTVLYHPNFARGELIGEGDPGFDGVIQQLQQEDATSELISYKLKNVDKQLASCKLRNGMLMICFAPVSEIYARQHMLIGTTAIITVVVVVVALCIAFAVSMRLVRPIVKLNDAAKHLTDGKFDFHIQPDSNDEIGELTTTFIETRKILLHQINLLDSEAHIDGLTGVGNKSAFSDREQEINQEIASGNTDFSLVVLDVNKLKVANDVFGHIAGDRLLLTVATHLAAHFGTPNVFRLGGDEFVVITTGDPAPKVERCIAEMKDLAVEGYPDCTVSCAFGVSKFDPATDRQLTDMLERADKEMYKNKALSKKEVLPWQEGSKGLKQLQVEKYCQLLKSLTHSTDDYLFLMNLEQGYIRFFGGSDSQFMITDNQGGLANLLSYVHVNDHSLVKQTLAAILNRETESFNIIFRMHSNSQMRWVNCRGKTISEDTENHYVVIGRLSQSAIQHLYNPVTTLFNKLKLNQDLQADNAVSFRQLMLIEIDNLSEINLKHGPDYRDQLLCTIADELEKRLATWQIYHAEKDRFVILLETDVKEEIAKLFQTIKTALAGKCAISAAVVPNDKSLFISADNIYDYAVQTINTANQNSQINFFSQESVLEHLSNVELWEEFDQSVKNSFEGFFLVYQPQISDEDYSIIAAEALLRFESKTKGNVYPTQFIPVLEQTGLINPVGLWVIDQALAQCKKWRALVPDFKISVNLSAKQIERKTLAAQVKALLYKHALPGEALILEITESSQLEENEDVHAFFHEIRQEGIQIAVDDFGTGYSNLGKLKCVHANILKIDRIFIKDISQNSYNYHLIHNVIEFAKCNDLKVCLEGVETSNELMILSGLNPDSFQGYLFDKPVSAEMLESRYFQADHAEFISRTQQITQLLNERKHAPIVNIETKTILRGINTGLWIMQMDAATGAGELYTDDVMKELLGVEGSITPGACYEHWQKNILPEYVPVMAAMMDEMKNSTKVIQAEYFWNHPQKGPVSIRCSGRCVETDNGTLTFEGFHRIMNDFGKSF